MTQDEDRVEYPSSDDDDQSVLGQKNKGSANYANEYDAACATLQLNFAPDNLPCRDREKEIILNYIMEGITNQGSSSSLYISGMPGTGKTVTTLETIKNVLKEKKENKKKKKSGDTSYNSTMKNVEYIHINAMNLTNPNLVYTILCEKIIGRRMNPQSAAQFLDEFFKKKDKK
jgi:Cdc6-like AAA superfamily ATPase